MPRQSRGLFLLLALLVLGGCSSVPRNGVGPKTANRAADVAASMVGTPYRYGGASPAKGFDCSGLVLYSYGRAGVRLLHGNDFLIKASHPVTLGNLQRGDLVFFNERGIRNSHVGIYLGNGRFVHAPSSGKKVYVADLESRYWQRSFAQARRVTTD